MTTLPPALYLLHTQPDARLLTAWAARHYTRSSTLATDMGDVLHGLLRAAFGEHAPQPFRYFGEQQGLLAYTTLAPQAMAAQVALADPVAAQALGLGTSSDHSGYRMRAFPSHWQTGQVLSFEVRVRPTVRGARGEQDAFLYAVAQVGGSSGTLIEREKVYADWLRAHLAVRDGQARQPWQGAVDLLDVRLRAFTRSPSVRRTQARPSHLRQKHAADGPDAILSGQLRIANPQAFAHLMARGVGRHRSFGFGMLLLSR